MKKFLRTTAAVLVLLLAGFGGYVQYRRQASFRTPIHRTATSVIRVNTYGIIQSLIPDYLGFSRNGSKEPPGSRPRTQPSGIRLPANLFVYTVAGKAPTTLFTRLELRRAADFRATVDRLLQGRTVADSGTAFTTVVSADGRLTIAYTHRVAALAWSLNREAVTGILGDILQQRQVVPVSESPFRRICDLPGHIVYLGSGQQAALNFRKGAIGMEASLPAGDCKPLAAAGSPAFPATAALSAYLHADIRAWLAGRTWSAGSLTLQADSLLRYYRGRASFTIDGTVPQQEKVVTYGYNDNFEKVAQTEVRAVAVPRLRLELEADPGLYAYLVREGVVQADSGTVSRGVFPLYQLYAYAAGGALVLTTASGREAGPGTQAGTGFAGMGVRFDVLRQQQVFPALLPYIRLLHALSCTATQLRGNRVQVRADMTFEDRQRNALLQLADNL